jgi:hypothetical protein
MSLRAHLADLNGIVAQTLGNTTSTTSPLRRYGAPGRIRTADASLRTAALYPLSYGGAADIVRRGVVRFGFLPKRNLVTLGRGIGITEGSWMDDPCVNMPP